MNGVATMGPSMGSPTGEPRKPSGVEQAFGRMASIIENLNIVIDKHANNLSPILIPEMPEKEEAKHGSSGSSPIEQTINDLADRIQHAVRRIGKLNDRIDL